jgi:hypothetical protein
VTWKDQRRLPTWTSRNRTGPIARQIAILTDMHCKPGFAWASTPQLAAHKEFVAQLFWGLNCLCGIGIFTHMRCICLIP